ncbi:MAG: SIS domain-containing protein [Promethearchaeota archaeon]|nr:MAG: SIS domain-containing protein [Candidatus Lokiarchaeota archaeon]
MNDLLERHFLERTYKYLVGKIKKSLDNVDKKEVYKFLDALKSGMDDKRVTVDGAGRSLQSVLLLVSQLENTYGIRVNQVNNANLRPLRGGDIFVANSRSAKVEPEEAKIVSHARFARKKGLDVFFITANEEIKDIFENVILIKKEGYNKEYAPLGTGFEQATATLMSCIACSYYKKNPKESFDTLCKEVIQGYNRNLETLLKQDRALDAFIEIVNEYLSIENPGVVYFKGMGINDIIAKVIAIRYGHLHKNNCKDLNVVYESHWRCRRSNDLGIFLSGSGQTTQMIKYLSQAKSIGMKTFVITSYKDSKLARSNQWYKNCRGNLIISGRSIKYSYFNQALETIDEAFFPQFELNTYLTLDALLALIAKYNNIDEEDMKKTHRDKELE